MGMIAAILQLSRITTLLLGRAPNPIGELNMFKKLLLAVVAAGLVSAAALPLQIDPAQAGMAGMAGMTCKDAAKMKYPDDRKMRHAYNKSCKEAYKMHSGKMGMMSKFKLRKDS